MVDVEFDALIRANVYDASGFCQTIYGPSLAAIATAKFGRRAQLSPRIGEARGGLCEWDVLLGEFGAAQIVGRIVIDTAAKE